METLARRIGMLLRNELRPFQSRLQSPGLSVPLLNWHWVIKVKQKGIITLGRNIFYLSSETDLRRSLKYRRGL